MRRYDHWEPAYEQRAKKGVTHAYRDAARHPSVPAFVVSAEEIIRDLNEIKISSQAAVQIHPARKRMIDENASQETLSKKLKVELPRSSTTNGHTVIDLTGDTPIEYAPTRLHTLRLPLANITNTTSDSSRASRSQRARTHQEQQQVAITSKVLKKIIKRLREKETSIDEDRDMLRKRWELDTNLQLQTTTDHLTELNECFKRAEDGIRDAITIINEHLLVR